MLDIILEIEKILARHDPEELICVGAPVDEYRQEAGEIAKQLSPGGSIEETTLIILDVFHRNFDVGYVLVDKPDGLVWTKHAIGMVNFSPGSRPELKLERQTEPNPARTGPIRHAAHDINLLLETLAEYQGEDVILKMKYQYPHDGDNGKAFLYLTEVGAGEVATRVTIPALASTGVESGKITLAFDKDGRLLCLESLSAVTVIPKTLLHQVWSSLSKVDLDPETLRNT